MARHYLALTPLEHLRLTQAAKKYGQSCQAFGLRAIMAEIERVEAIPTHAPPSTQRLLDERAAAQELRSLLDDDGNVVGSL